MVRRLLREQVAFFEQALRASRQVGAFSPTSPVVAAAMADALPAPGAAPRRLLEVGAGMGAITETVVRRLAPQDRLDLCEINPSFAAHLRERFTSEQVQVFEGDVAELPSDAPYGAVIASLPLLNMDPAVVDRIFARLLTELLEPGGTLVYYDYWAKAVRRYLPASRQERRRVREVLAITRGYLDRYEVRREVILRNVPPAHVHVLRRPFAS